jgi:hypothetical protein
MKNKKLQFKNEKKSFAAAVAAVLAAPPHVSL